ncbi:MAG: hypothetical protein P8Z41_04935 [Anaerolineales bacterium]
MYSHNGTKLKLKLDDVRDWAFCPLRVWWRKTGLAKDVADTGGKRTGEKLVRESILSAIALYYKVVKNKPDFTFGEGLGLVWKKWLDAWELSDTLAAHLIDYQNRRRSLLRRFEEGAITKRSGEKYKRPTWTRYWREMAETSGLSSIRKMIDRHQSKIGMGVLDLPDDEYYQSPIGLADAFANSMDMARNINLPDPKGVLGVQVPMFVELPSVKLQCRVDIVRMTGTSKPVGRPSKNEDKKSFIYKLECIILLFDEGIPSLYSLSRDLRVLAFGQAEVESDVNGGEYKVDRVRILHLPSGESQELTPRLGDGSEILESLSRSVITGIRGGVYVPRMVCGWKSCGDCEYRILCYSDAGVMEAFNPPLMSQIETSQSFRADIDKFMYDNSSSANAVDMLRSFVGIMAKSPGITPEGVLWMLDNIEGDQQ